MLYGTLRRLIKNVYNGFGLYDMPNAAAPTLNIGAGGEAYLVSDNAGVFRLPEDKFQGIDSVYDGTTGEFDFSKLPLGTVVEFRIDLDVDTSGANTNMDIVVEAGIGSPEGSFELPLTNTIFHTIAGVKRVLPYQMFVIGAERTRDYPLKLKFKSDKAVDVDVNGFTLNIRKKFNEPS